MTRPRSPIAGLQAVLTILIVLSGSTLSLAAEPGGDEEQAEGKPLTTLQLIEKDMEKIRKHIRSAEIKLRKGAVGMSSGSDGVNTTLGQRCCSGNLDHMGEGLASMRKNVTTLGQCYEDRRQRSSMDALDLVNEDMDTLTQGLGVFRASRTPADATGSMDGCKRAYINLYRSTQQLTECPPLVSPPAEGTAGADDD